MGIDAQMFVRHPGKLSSEQVRRLSSDLSAAFHQGPFMISRPGKFGFWPSGRHALEIIEAYEQDGPTLIPKPGEQFIEVHLSGRYYGEGYERGDWPTYSAIAMWLLNRIPNCSVWYGGDSSGVCAEQLTPKRMRQMWEHFIQSGHEPYAERDNPFMSHPTKPTCEFCMRTMAEYSWGPNGRVGFVCMSCGYKARTDDNGATFYEENEQSRTNVQSVQADTTVALITEGPFA